MYKLNILFIILSLGFRESCKEAAGSGDWAGQAAGSGDCMEDRCLIFGLFLVWSWRQRHDCTGDRWPISDFS